MGGGGLGGRNEEEKKRERERRAEERKYRSRLTFAEKRRQEAAPARVGRKRRKKGTDISSKLPQSKHPVPGLTCRAVNPMTKCRLRLLRAERVKDYLLMEEEFIKN